MLPTSTLRELQSLLQRARAIDQTSLFIVGEPIAEVDALLLRVAELIATDVPALEAADLVLDDNVSGALEYSTSQTLLGGNYLVLDLPLQRRVFTGTLPNATSAVVELGVAIGAVPRIWGIATDGTTYLPMPFGAQIETDSILLDVNVTQLTITTAADYSDHDYIIILEYALNA